MSPSLPTSGAAPSLTAGRPLLPLRVALVSTHRADENHYAPLRRLLETDERFELNPDDSARLWTPYGHHLGDDHNLYVDADIAVVLGDRYEMLQRAMIYVEARIPLLHLHGGEHTYGSLDERWRWAITAMADVHCVATHEAADEIDAALGHARCRSIHVTGAPGLDGITDTVPLPGGPRIMVAYNPAIDADTTAREARAIREALAGIEGVWWSVPNGDQFSDQIPWKGQPSNGQFREMLAGAQVIVGNSSAGIIEAPSLGTWTVNVGERQAGRPRAGSILDVGADATTIRRGIIDMLLQPRGSWRNPYGDGGASARIRDVLLGMAK